MKTILKLFLSAIFVFSLSCNKSDTFDDGVLKGIWVHTETKMDTIDFNVSPENTFSLKRAWEMRDGHLLPGYGQGLYWYRIEGDSIYLRSWVSSYSGSFACYFKMEEDGKSFLIGNFAPFGGLLVNRFKRIR